MLWYVTPCFKFFTCVTCFSDKRLKSGLCSQPTCIEVLSLPPMSHVTLSKWLNFSVPQFVLLQNELHDSSYLTGCEDETKS